MSNKKVVRLNRGALIPWIAGAATIGTVFALLFLLDKGAMPSPARMWRLGAFDSALRYLISFVGVWLTYWFAKIAVQVSPSREHWLGELTQYLLCIGACAFIAFGLAATLGTHQEDSDPALGSGGYTVVDYEPTKDERTKHGLVVFLCLAIPALYGTSKALQESRTCTTCGCSGFHQEDCPEKRRRAQPRRG